MMLPKHAQVVIIGAGIAGCSVAYHLTKLGWHEIVVVDQGPLFETGGSTSHAPGLVFQINASKTMTEFARHSVDLWTQMELDGELCTRQVGSMEVAWTPERLTDLKRKHGYGLAWGVDCHLLTPDEARARFPLLSDRIYRCPLRPLRHPDQGDPFGRSDGARGRANRRPILQWCQSYRLCYRRRARHRRTDNPRRDQDRPRRRRHRHLGAQGRRHGKACPSHSRRCNTSTP